MNHTLRGAAARRAAPSLAAFVGLTLATAGCGPSDTPAPTPVAVLSAFPAELAPHLAAASIDETQVIDGHAFHLGSLEGVPVILAMTGIGLDNATATTRVLLERFQVAAVLVSGVAGSSQLRIGDVAVPEVWLDDSGVSFPVDTTLAARARSSAAEADAILERCTEPPPLSTAPPGTICLDEAPRIAVGGTGHSSDPFGDTPLVCRGDDDDVFGCDPAVREAARGASTPPAPIAEDMETAAIAREAAARGIPFLAFRAMSDGPGDPLGLPGFPSQFFTYYRLAAVNAAHAVWAFLRSR